MENLTFKRYYNATTQRFPRPHRSKISHISESEEASTAQSSVDTEEKNAPNEMAVSGTTGKQRRGLADGGQSKSGYTEKSIDLPSAGPNSWLQTEKNIPMEEIMKYRRICAAEDSRISQFSQSCVDPALPSLLPDVDDAAKTTQSSFQKFQIAALHAGVPQEKLSTSHDHCSDHSSEEEPTHQYSNDVLMANNKKYEVRSKYVARSSRRTLNSSTIDLFTSEKSVQADLKEAIEYGGMSSVDKAAVNETIQQLQNQLSTALTLLREYMRRGESADRFPSQRRISFVPDGMNAPSTVYSASPESPGDVPLEDEDSPILSKESETARQLISLASQISMPLSAIKVDASSNRAECYDQVTKDDDLDVHDDEKVVKNSSLFNDHEESSIQKMKFGETSIEETQKRQYEDLVLDNQHLKLKLQAMDDFVAKVMESNEVLSQDRAAIDESRAVLQNECSELLKTRKQLENDRDAYLLERAKLTNDKAVMHAEMEKLIQTLDCACRERAELVNRIDNLSRELEQVTHCFDQVKDERNMLLERQVQLQIELDRFSKWHKRIKREQGKLCALQQQTEICKHFMIELENDIQVLHLGLRQLLQSEACWSEMMDEQSQAKYWMNRSHPAAVWCTVAMVRPLELGDLLAVIRLTRGSAQAISSDNSGSGRAHDDHVSRRGWGWSTKSIFKKQGAKMRTSMQPAESASEAGL